MENTETKKRGPAAGTAVRLGRPNKATALTAANDTLREHLARPADPARPHLGTTYELVKLPLSQLLTPARRLGAWWRRERVTLTQEELDACWRWLLPQ